MWFPADVSPRCFHLHVFSSVRSFLQAELSLDQPFRSAVTSSDDSRTCEVPHEGLQTQFHDGGGSEHARDTTPLLSTLVVPIVKPLPYHGRRETRKEKSSRTSHRQFIPYTLRSIHCPLNHIAKNHYHLTRLDNTRSSYEHHHDV